MDAPNTFSIVQGELVIRSSSTDEILWKGKLYGIEVEKVLPLFASEDMIVLLSWRGAITIKKKNLLRINSMGNIVWVVDSPPIKNSPGPDRDFEVYSDVEIIDDTLIAFAMKGYSDHIDIHTGKILKSIFVK